MPQPDLISLKSRVDLASVVKSGGVELVRAGKEYKGLCPFHTEKTPSFHVNPHKGLYHCFGCGASGDVLDYLQKREGLDFKASLEKLRTLAGESGNGANGSGNNRAEDGKNDVRKEDDMSSHTDGDSSVERDFTLRALAEGVPSSSESPLLDGRIQKAVKEVFSHYEKILVKNTEAQQYLMSRGIRGEDVLRTFPMGYCDGKLPSLLPPAQSPEGGELRAALIRAGIISSHNNQIREHFAGCVVFAIADENGVIRQIYGRRIANGRGAKHLYLPGPHDTFFNPHALRQDSLILCEGLFDALSFWVQGVRNVSFTYGTNGLTPPLLDALRDSGVSRVILAFDADKGGRKSAEKVIALLCSSGLRVSVAELPDDSDPNGLHVKGESLSVYVESSTVADCADAEEKLDFAEKSGEDAENQPSAAAKSASVNAEGSSVVWRMEGETGDRVIFEPGGDRRYRVDGMRKNRAAGSLSVTIHAEQAGEIFIEQLQLYSSKDRDKFIRMCAKQFSAHEETVRSDLTIIVRELRDLQDRLIEQDLRPKEKEEVVVSEARTQRALSFLRTENFRSRFSHDARTLGLVGEEINFELGFYIVISRILSGPLHGMVKSASASGKSTLLDVLARMCPPEDLLRLSSMSSQALYYMEDLSNKVIILEEDAGMETAHYSLKILQTEGVLRKGTVFRDPQSGRAQAMQIEVKGPVASLVASTSTLEREEQDNRYLLLAMNESREQTEAILTFQRELETSDREESEVQSRMTSELYQDAVRLIKNRPVINPYATRLLFVIRRHRFRRDQPKILRLVRLITLSNQYQREGYTEIKNGHAREYLLSSVQDNVLALRLATHALGRSLDEMSPHTRHFLEQFRELISSMSLETKTEKRYCRVLRRDLARCTGLSASTVHSHLQALHRLDYIVFHKDERRRDRIELVDDGADENGGIPDPLVLEADLTEWESEQRSMSGGRPDFWRAERPDCVRN